MIVSAYQEEERIAPTLAAVARAFPGARVLVADDGSRDRTPDAVRAAGVELVRSERSIGKGGAMTLAAQRLLESPPAIVVLCDGDLEETAPASWPRWLPPCATGSATWRSPASRGAWAEAWVQRWGSRAGPPGDAAAWSWRRRSPASGR